MSEVPKGRLGRLARLAVMGARSGAGMLMGGDAAAESAAQVLGNLRGLAAKVGQLASYVDGVVPEGQRESYERALGVLRAQAPTSSWESVRAVLERELGGVEPHFASFEPTPIASASIGQVHRARLHDGSEVAVKVQHPGIEQAVESDLANVGLLEGVATLLGGRRFDAASLLEVVRTRFREELDYGLEASRMDTFAALHRGDRWIRIPKPYWEHSSKRVLTSELVRGLDFDAACAASEAERRAWAQTLWRFMIKSLLGAGLLHADPHPGNYFFQPDGVITFLDYGCVQQQGDEHRLRAVRTHRAALAGDRQAFEAAAKVMLQTKPGAMERPALDYLDSCFRCLFERPFRMTRPYAAALVTEMRQLANLARTAPLDEVMTMPTHVLFMNRLQFGLYSVLARLDVEVDYLDVERVILAELDGAEALHA
jgi:predicted unusual protein kinase regulating ubiquinone biosynthesis (AarF/ABC1/UbiB family)